MIDKTYYRDLTKMNTFRMKVTARTFIEYDSVADLVEIDFEELPRPVLHIGGGSNLLFTDDFKGTVLHSKVNFIEIISGAASGDCPDEVSSGRLCESGTDEVLVSVGSGVVFDDFCAWAAKEGLWGVENLSGIPGEAGASAVQNIGAYGVEAKDMIRTVYCYDTEEEEFVHFDVNECRYGYRDSFFKHPEVKGRYIVTHVVFALSRKPAPRLEYGHLRAAFAGCGEEQLTPASIRKAIMGIRREKLPEPSVMGSAGSFFKNPVVSVDEFARITAVARAAHGEDYEVPHYEVYENAESCGPDGGSAGGPVKKMKVPAAWMIEQCGWKGRRSGGAAVYDKQPLVIVNYTGEAYPEEIIGLEKRIISSVYEKFGVMLHPEVEHV